MNVNLENSDSAIDYDLEQLDNVTQLNGWLGEADGSRNLAVLVRFELDQAIEPAVLLIHEIWTMPQLNDRGLIKESCRRVFEAAVAAGATRAVGVEVFDTKPLEAHGAIKTAPRRVEWELKPPGEFYTWLLNEPDLSL